MKVNIYKTINNRFAFQFSSLVFSTIVFAITAVVQIGWVISQIYIGNVDSFIIYMYLMLGMTGILCALAILFLAFKLANPYSHK